MKTRTITEADKQELRRLLGLIPDEPKRKPRPRLQVKPGPAPDYPAGWHLLPVHSWNEGCTCGRDCGSPGKHPRTRNGVKNATSDQSQLREWSGRWPGCNWAVRTGPESDLLVIDVDNEAEWERLLNGRHAHTVTARTGSGGLHVFFKYPQREVKNSQGQVAAGIDVRGLNGYVILPGSVNRSGSYSWINAPADIPVADAPDWLLELL